MSLAHFIPVSERGPRTSIAAVQEVVARQCGVSVSDLRGPCRERRYVHPRQIAMVLARELTGSTLPEIGRQFGNRDHTTVIHAMKNVARLSAEKPNFADKVQVIRASVPQGALRIHFQAAMSIGVFLARMGAK